VIGGLEVSNAIVTEGQGINKVVIKDSKTLELFYNSAITEEEFEFKLLSESTINALSGKDNTISVSFVSELSEYSNYILMLLSVKDRLGTQLTFDEDLHDFGTEAFVIQEPEVEEPVVEETPAEEDTAEPAVEETPIPEEDE
jgi:hypothetical protein